MSVLPSCFRKDYEELKELGKGSYGRVHLAKKRETGEKFAIKVLRPGPSIEEARERFKQEIKIMNEFSSRYIVEVVDHEFTDDAIGVVMKYLPEGDLGLLETPLEIDEVLAVARDIGKGLKEPHTRDPKVVHRDVKPSNILIWRDEHDCRRYKLTDFGIAYVMRPDQGSENYTQKNLGTAGYSAIEHLDGSPDTPSDIFSLGAVLYQLLTGRLPFGFNLGDGMSNYDRIIRQTEGPERVSQYRPNVHSWLDKLVLECLAEDKAERPSVNDFLGTIDDNIDSVWEKYWKKGNRHKRNEEFDEAKEAWLKAYQLRPDDDLRDKLDKLPPANRRGKTKAPLRDNNIHGRARRSPHVETLPPAESKDVSEPSRHRKSWSKKILVAAVLAASVLLYGGYIFTSLGGTESTALNGDDRFAFSSGGERLATSGRSGNKVRLWKAGPPSWAATLFPWSGGGALQAARALEGTSGEAPDHIAFDGERHLVLLYLAQGKIARWGVGADAMRQKHAISERARAGALAPDGELAAISTPQGIVLRDTGDGRQLGVLPGSSFDPGRLLFSPDGRYMAASEYMNHGVVVWDVQDRSVQYRFDAREGSAAVPQIVFSPDGSMLSASGPSAVRVWNLNTGKRSTVLTPEAKHESGPAVSFASQRLLATVWPDGTAGVYDIKRGRQQAALKHGADTATINTSNTPAAAFSPDGEVLATALPSTGVLLWDPMGGEKLRKLRLAGHKIRKLAFSPKDRLLVARTDSSLVTWRLDDLS